ncbi:MAG: helicase [Planctomycetota bacterium]|nr:MAG: helicase [Planctomycetota bacterium]
MEQPELAPKQPNDHGLRRVVPPAPVAQQLIVQADRSVLLEVGGEGFEDARDFLALFCELEKAPEHVHFYRITEISIWNAAAAGLALDDLLTGLAGRSKFPLPSSLEKEIRDWYERFGKLRLIRDEGQLFLESQDQVLLAELASARSVAKLLAAESGRRFLVEEGRRGLLKQALIKLGYPVDDLAGYREGGKLEGFALRDLARSGEPFALRAYQSEAARVFHAGGSVRGGSGVIVLPCGAGKTIVGLAAIERLATQTLILTTNTVAVRQWKRELLDKTTLREDQVGEYTGDLKEIRDVTVATYQILTYRKKRGGEFEHFGLFEERDWGLVVYDEVHLLPAPVFRATAELQARRRLGLTATLVREDGKEDEVFSLIGPKRYEVPWRELEGGGFIAEAECYEIRVPLPAQERQNYLEADSRQGFRLASCNPLKFDVVAELLERHRSDRVLVIGQYLDQLDELSRRFDMPLITGKTGTAERERLYGAFRSGEIERLAVSKVGNFAIDLPDANVAIQISGSFGSRQEEAQRLGRILRPKGGGGRALFYALVTGGTLDQDYAARRQRFLAEQGYGYEIREWGGLKGEAIGESATPGEDLGDRPDEGGVTS